MKHLEIRAVDGLSVNGKKIIGRPVVYNSPSQDLGGFIEVIERGAFGDSIKGDIRALFEHDHTKLLGRTASGTMAIREDNQGIIVEIEPPNTRTADELMVSIERGDIAGMSFGFTVNENGAKWDFDQQPTLRTVTNANLSEVTITSLPAYKATNVEVAKRSMPKVIDQAFIDYPLIIELNRW